MYKFHGKCDVLVTFFLQVIAFPSENKLQAALEADITWEHTRKVSLRESLQNLKFKKVDVNDARSRYPRGGRYAAVWRIVSLGLSAGFTDHKTPNPPVGHCSMFLASAYTKIVVSGGDLLVLRMRKDLQVWCFSNDHILIDCGLPEGFTRWETVMCRV